MTVGLMAPVYNYASSRRRPARHGVDREATPIVAALWSRFSAVGRTTRTPGSRHVSADELSPSRWQPAVSAPYRKLMTANIQVDQATASSCAAPRPGGCGVPRSSRFVVAGATRGRVVLSERADWPRPRIRLWVRGLEHPISITRWRTSICTRAFLGGPVPPPRSLPFDDDSAPARSRRLTFAGPGKQTTRATRSRHRRSPPRRSRRVPQHAWLVPTKHRLWGLLGRPRRRFATSTPRRGHRAASARVPRERRYSARDVEAYTVRTTATASPKRCHHALGADGTPPVRSASVT